MRFGTQFSIYTYQILDFFFFFLNDGKTVSSLYVFVEPHNIDFRTLTRKIHNYIMDEKFVN